jgi:hypothetical protein
MYIGTYIDITRGAGKFYKKILLRGCLFSLKYFTQYFSDFLVFHFFFKYLIGKMVNIKYIKIILI